MKEHEFTPQQREYFGSHPAIASVGRYRLTYASSFKKQALELYAQGISPAQIFKDAGLDVSMFPHKYVRNCLKRWRDGARKQATSTIVRRRGRPPKSSSTKTIEAMQARIVYLEAENDFLKKLRALESDE